MFQAVAYLGGKLPPPPRYYSYKYDRNLISMFMIAKKREIHFFNFAIHASLNLVKLIKVTQMTSYDLHHLQNTQICI